MHPSNLRCNESTTQSIVIVVNLNIHVKSLVSDSMKPSSLNS